MSDLDKSGTRRGLTAEERAVLCRVSYDWWLEWCRRERLVHPYGLPSLYAPVPRKRAMEFLAQDHGDDEHRTRYKQNVASLYSLGGGNALSELDSAFGSKYRQDGLDSLVNVVVHDKKACGCCHAGRAWRPSSPWFLRHRFRNATLVSFDPDTQVTTIRSNYYVSAPATVTQDQVAAMMKALAQAVNPENWSSGGGTSFRRSEAIELTKKGDPAKEWFEGGMDWKGKLIESFAWDWNPDASMEIDNILNVNFRFDENKDGQKGMVLDYSLSESLSSKLWLARQAGGLDIDRGFCEIRDLGPNKKTNVDPEHPPYLMDPDATPSGQESKPSKHHNILVRTQKTLRFTPVQNAPSWFSTLINYQTPVLAGMWMSKAAQASISNAIAATSETTVNQSPKKANLAS